MKFINNIKQLVTSILLFFIFFLISPSLILAQSNSKNTLEAEVIEIKASGQQTVMEELVPFQQLELKVLTKERSGEVIEIENVGDPSSVGSLKYEEYQVGDELVIGQYQDMEGEIVYAIAGRLKRDGLIALAIIFVVVVVLVGRKWGILSLLGLCLSFVIIINVIFPLLINGMNPVFSAVIGSLIIIPVTFYISHGFNLKTHSGVIATLLALIVTGLMATLFVHKTHLTGLASEEAGFLQVETQGSYDMRALLLAGIIIGALGVLDDITVGQASVVKQIKQAQPKISLIQLFKKAMKVGQDHISSMVNTLVLVYTGSSLPLLLLLKDSDTNVASLLEYELIAEEIVRMLVGSIGLIISAPLATIVAAYLFTRNSDDL
jgi:uncharacterized membrane protein